MGGRSATVHVFLYRDRRFGYFPAAGRLVRLHEVVYDALRHFELGFSWKEARSSCIGRFGRSKTRMALASLRAIRDVDLLRKPPAMVRRRKLADWRDFLAHRPRNIMLFVTEACNLRCSYCYEVDNEVHDDGRHMRSADARRIVEQFLQSSGPRRDVGITFFGGEPLLNFRVVREVVEYANRRAEVLHKNVGYAMTTNLTLMTEGIADFLVAHQVNVMVSVDGNKEQHDANRLTKSGEGTYDSVVKNLRLLLRKQRSGGTRPARVRATLSSGNCDLLQVERDLLKLGAERVDIGAASGTVFGRDEYDIQDAPGYEMIEGQIEDAISAFLVGLSRGKRMRLPEVVARSLMELDVQLGMGAEEGELYPRLCGVCRNMKAVTPNGDVYPCHRYVGMRKFRIGNFLRPGGIDRVRVLRYYRKVQESFGEDCSTCWLRRICGGQCPWYLSGKDGRIGVPRVEECDELRASYERLMGLYGIMRSEYEGDLGEVLAQCVSMECGVVDE